MASASRVCVAILGALTLLDCAGHAAPPGRPRPPGRDSVAAVEHLKGSVLERAWADYDASRYGDAETGFRQAQQSGGPSARLGLAEVLLVTGRAGLAENVASDAIGAPPAVALDLLRVRAEALRRLGKLDQAEALLLGAAGDPDARRVRLLLGEVLLEEGRRTDAEPVLMTLIEQYNRDAIDPKDATALSIVGRAAYLLGSAQDANDAFNEAERAGAADTDTLLWRAELFLESYDPGHAEEVISELLSKAPHQPEALAQMAQVKLASNLDFEAAEDLANDALAVDPTLTLADFVLGGVALRDMNLKSADGFIDSGLKGNPRDLPLLSLRAAVRFLADDQPGFERAKKDVLSKNPRYSRLYQIVGEYAEWEHRYDEIVNMMREALLADSEDAKVRAQLGFNLIRGGHEAEGVSALQRAFSADPFNVRVFNTLNLYEKEIPAGYVTVTHGRFTIRYHKDEKDVLDRYVPDLLDRAWSKLAKKYDFVPTTPIGVELYPVREHFAIRTSGLPQTFIQGVCFGKTLAAMSPKIERFNIGMTLWHELSHVFHIQLSKSHVPRWFTEGLAEYETLVERPEWRREYDGDLYQALEHGNLPEVADMNRSFSHAEDMQDMATAYYASTQVVGFIVDRWGMPKIHRMLELWAEGKRTPEVVKEALGVSAEEVDRDFRTMLEARLSRFKGQFAPPTKSGDPRAAATAADASPKDAKLQALAGLAWMGVGEEEKAKANIGRALALDAKLPLALWLEVQLAKTNNDKAAAAKALKALIQTGQDGYVVRLTLSDVVDSPTERRAALEAAHGFDPLQSAPLDRLADLAREAHDTDAELSALRQYVVLEENNGDAYRRLMTLLLARHAYDEAKHLGEAAIYVDMESTETHRLYAESLAGCGARKEAIFELESAVRAMGSPAELAQSHGRLAELLDEGGDRAGAAAHKKMAAELGKQGRTGPI